MEFFKFLYKLYKRVIELLQMVFKADYSFFQKEVFGISIFDIIGALLALWCFIKILEWILGLGFDAIRKVTDRIFSMILPSLLSVTKIVLFRAYRTAVYLSQRGMKLIKIDTFKLKFGESKMFKKAISWFMIFDDLKLIIKNKLK